MPLPMPPVSAFLRRRPVPAVAGPPAAGGPTPPPAPPPPPPPVTVTEIRPAPPAPAPEARHRCQWPPPTHQPIWPWRRWTTGGAGPGAWRPDGVAGVALHADHLDPPVVARLRIRQPAAGDQQRGARKAGTISPLAQVSHARRQHGRQGDQRQRDGACRPPTRWTSGSPGAAVWYAAQPSRTPCRQAGNEGEDNCACRTRCSIHLNANDPGTGIRSRRCPRRRGSPTTSCRWVRSTTRARRWPIVLPGRGFRRSHRGRHHGLSPQNGGPVNAYPPSRAGDPNTPVLGQQPRGVRQWRGGAGAGSSRNSPPTRSSTGYPDRPNPPRESTTRSATVSWDPVAALTFDVRTVRATYQAVREPGATLVPPPPAPDHRPAISRSASCAGAAICSPPCVSGLAGRRRGGCREGVPRPGSDLPRHRRHPRPGADRWRGRRLALAPRWAWCSDCCSASCRGGDT